VKCAALNFFAWLGLNDLVGQLRAAREQLAEQTQTANKALMASFEREARLRAKVARLTEPYALPECSAWTQENGAALRAFLDTAAGKACTNRLRTVVISAAIAGAKKQTNATYAAGVSAGWDEAVRYLHSLSRVSGAQDTKPNDGRPPGETDLLEQLSP